MWGIYCHSLSHVFPWPGFFVLACYAPLLIVIICVHIRNVPVCCCLCDSIISLGSCSDSVHALSTLCWLSSVILGPFTPLPPVSSFYVFSVSLSFCIPGMWWRGPPGVQSLWEYQGQWWPQIAEVLTLERITITLTLTSELFSRQGVSIFRREGPSLHPSTFIFLPVATTVSTLPQ